jgi:hypothetical protein
VTWQNRLFDNYKINRLWSVVDTHKERSVISNSTQQTLSLSLSLSLNPRRSCTSSAVAGMDLPKHRPTPTTSLRDASDSSTGSWDALEWTKIEVPFFQFNPFFFFFFVQHSWFSIYLIFSLLISLLLSIFSQLRVSSLLRISISCLMTNKLLPKYANSLLSFFLSYLLYDIVNS